ncbi:TonB-dependent receptor [Avrilella dinanensis]|uniref:TonB-dependent receptor n=1 Tax=Avrilella dinanensis TaxID=2008672 RepID=A0A2M9R8D4_9FLAO|nr:TonB-dependent receptor [Avrilella dinanensis]PJR05035.1 TonB-dependent receptor [Avrilella dinanensis]
MRKLLLITTTMMCFCVNQLIAQTTSVGGTVADNGLTIENASVYLENTSFHTQSDSLGYFQLTNVPFGEYLLVIEANYYDVYTEKISLSEGENKTINIDLSRTEDGSELEELVISGTMKPVNRLESPVPVEVYTQEFFKKNPTPTFFDALQNINGVRPQLNCNVCDTGDIHINGLEGAYTMVLIDGMPIVSSLGSVYGLSGIPSSLIERIEVVKGPASSLYGSEAVGGVINIITKNPNNAPLFSADVFTTSWLEHNVDLGLKLNAGKKASVLTGINYFNYQNKVDNNKDNFTDVTLQDRFSVFQKWNFSRKDNRLFSLAGRYLYEDRWGGDMRWNKSHRGGDEIYGESIYTSRAEIIGNYQLPVSEKMFFNFSLINHDQDSRYGYESYIANQKIAFGQLIWDKKIGRHDLLTGAALRYTYYDDNTPATAGIDGSNEAEKTWLPGVFIQDEITLEEKHKLLLGFRYDHNNHHGNIFTPRMAYKWTLNDNSILRLNAGTGFRVVNLFTEDHAALTGARDVIILNDLKPEKSYNANLNYVKKFYFDSGAFLGFDATAFYTHFTNKIAPDYETNSNQIIYDNLDGYAVSKGISLNVDLNLPNGLKFILGGTLMENTLTENGITEQQMLTEKFTGTWAVSYKILPWDLSIDYTGNVYSPMRLPLLGDLDPRPENSPWWSIQNIQLTYDGFDRIEIYGGVKNLLNWTPGKGLPFLIARSHDPFDKDVVFDGDGQAVSTPGNPYALTFDPSYVYAPNQGMRGFLGVRFKLD